MNVKFLSKMSIKNDNQNEDFIPRNDLQLAARTQRVRRPYSLGCAGFWVTCLLFGQIGSSESRVHYELSSEGAAVGTFTSTQQRWRCMQDSVIGACQKRAASPRMRGALKQPLSFVPAVSRRTRA